MKWKLILIVVATFSILSGCASTNPSITNTIQGYLQTVVNQNWSSLNTYLTGEALNNANKNTQKIGKLITTQLIEVKPKVIIENDKFSVVDVDFITEQQSSENTFTSINHQRFYLIMQETAWKIYSIEPLSKPIKDANKTNSDDKVTQVIEQYIKSVTQNDLNKAVSLLTGPLQENGMVTMGSINRIKNIQTKVSNLAIEPLALNSQQAYMKATYDVDNIFTDGKTISKKMVLGIDLEKVKDKWLISKITEIN